MSEKASCPKCGTELGGVYEPCPNCLVRRNPPPPPALAIHSCIESVEEGVKEGLYLEGETLSLWETCFDRLMLTGYFERDGAAKLEGLGVRITSHTDLSEPVELQLVL